MSFAWTIGVSLCLQFILAELTFAQLPGGLTLTGTVTMPDGPARQVIRRGDAYRNRGGEARTDTRTAVEAMNHPDRNVIVILYPTSGSATLEPTPNAVLLQTEKSFVPRVLPVTKGSVVTIQNADEFFHNVFSITPGARFNIGRRPPGDRQTRRIEKSGEIQLFCDIHPQMNAVILSLETPWFARVDEQGRYRIPGLPAGNYRYEIYHPEAGILKGNLTLQGQGETLRHFDLRTLKN